MFQVSVVIAVILMILTTVLIIKSNLSSKKIILTLVASIILLIISVVLLSERENIAHNNILYAEKEIIVGIYNNHLPYATLISSNEAEGLEVALVKEIASNMGFRVKFIIVPSLPLEEVFKEQNVDFIIGNLSLDDDHKGVVFSNSYMERTEIIIAREDFAEKLNLFGSKSDIFFSAIRGKDIGIYLNPSDFKTTSLYLAKSKAIILTYKDVNKLITDILSKKITVGVTYNIDFLYNTTQTPNSALEILNLSVNNKVRNISAAFPLKSNLLEKFNSSLISIKATMLNN